LNRLLSAGVDRRWRRRTVRLVPPRPGDAVLDVCTGTADLALAYWREGRDLSIAGADFCRPMLAIGQAKLQRAGARATLVEADALRLPFADESFDIVCVAFGLRNLSDTAGGLREMARVCRRGGKVAVLEFSLPRFAPLRAVYLWYFRRVLPRIGQAVARNRQNAYNYLPESVGQFPPPEALGDLMRQAGLGDVRHHPFSLGIATLTVATKP
jgi:demethylmenaquinone methyltransferase/2-methoxy-6-polyprenyl-1,4-benzoquinol methylase